jgi:hypothetical protein
MIAGSVSVRKVEQNGFMLMPHLQLPQMELRHLERERRRAKETLRRARIRLRNVRLRMAELKQEIRQAKERNHGKGRSKDGARED